MTKVKDIVTMKIPFPKLSSNLAVKSHMYLCIKHGENKRFLSCQTKKPLLLRSDEPPFHFVDVGVNKSECPFVRDTLIACDYYFQLSNIHINPSLLAQKGVSSNIYSKVDAEIKHPNFKEQKISVNNLLKINPELTFMNAQ
ncbi:hypothetical protein [Tetragenococcus halophilus]|uniref:Uncharacterized protein n=1 Tax=Tetragenococcus halophilus (strain DSM 20338 / JCM 20259 / NCIMB 9735 / NBRC 12172) TaxID=945021 RepID=A0AAN1VRI1_TETHN|nr:hypothetical protein [Tetragenococcus halophilus]BAK95117.1 hypothetical protein TEH_17900 [Tetragenococcus halophilus NBRC 12172]